MKLRILLCCLVAGVGLFAAAESGSDEQRKYTASPKSDAADKFIGQEAGQLRDPWGLCDMHGNVWELCSDLYIEKFPGGSDPEVKLDEATIVATKRSERVMRGGS